MAYRNPAFLVANRVAVAGAAAISSSTLATGEGKERLVDGRLARLARFNAAAANQFLEVDLGSALSSNRLVIPAGHNLSGCSIELRAGAATNPATVIASVTPASSALVDVSFGAASHRFWRLVFITSGQWALGEWVLGTYAQTTTGVVSTWGNTIREPVLVETFPTREASILEGPARRELALEHRALTGADLATYDAVLASGRSSAFWHWPVDDALGPLLVKLSDAPRREQDSPNPKGTGTTYKVALELLEQAS